MRTGDDAISPQVYCAGDRGSGGGGSAAGAWRRRRGRETLRFARYCLAPVVKGETRQAREAVGERRWRRWTRSERDGEELNLVACLNRRSDAADPFQSECGPEVNLTVPTLESQYGAVFLVGRWGTCTHLR